MSGRSARHLATVFCCLAFLKLFHVRERLAVQFRAQCFNITNTPNFGQPGNSVTAPNFGVVQTTRSQRRDFSSSRQIEFALKMLFYGGQPPKVEFL
jgi:hypothetical protein